MEWRASLRGKDKARVGLEVEMGLGGDGVGLDRVEMRLWLYWYYNMSIM